MTRRYAANSIIILIVFIISTGMTVDTTRINIYPGKNSLSPSFEITVDSSFRPDDLCIKKFGVYDNYGRYDYPANVMWEIEVENDEACIGTDKYQYGVVPDNFREIVKSKNLVKDKKYDIIIGDNSGEVTGQFMIIEGENGERIEEIFWPDIKMERSKEDCFVKVVFVAQRFIDGKWSQPEYKLFPYAQSGEFDHYIYIRCSEFERFQNKLDSKVIEPLGVSIDDFFKCACTENDDRIPPDTPIWVGIAEPERPPFETSYQYSEELGKDVKTRRIIVICFAKVENPKYE